MALEEFWQDKKCLAVYLDEGHEPHVAQVYNTI